MPKRASNSERGRPESAAAGTPDVEAEAAAAGEPHSGTILNAASSVASHDALFGSPHVVHCDACGSVLDDEPERDPFCGRGVYMWTRGEEVRFEEAPLCASCASAIGLTALARWEIEEEEG